jgi:hypothetical protein
MTPSKIMLDPAWPARYANKIRETRRQLQGLE